MSIDALTQAKSTLEGVRGALGIYSKTEVDMTLGMLDRAIAKYTDLDAICQDLQEKTYTQAMRIAELEEKLAEKQDKFCDDNCVWTDHHPDCVRSDIKQTTTHEYPSKSVLARFEGTVLLNIDGSPNTKREWVGLTDEEIDECDWGQSERDHARAIEAKLKEKNT